MDNQIKSLLLPREKHQEAKKQYGQSPFTFKIIKEDIVLFYFGANHSHNPANLQYSLLREYWERFLALTEGKERIVLVENQVRKLVEDEEKAIKGGSENNFITLLAHRAGVQVACPDINKLEYIKLNPDIDRKIFFLHTFLSWVDQQQKFENFEDSCARWCEFQKTREEWNGLDFSLEAIKRIYKEVIGREFNPEENQNNYINPNRSDSKINELSRAYSDEREISIVSGIKGYWEKGTSIFAVFGSGHLIIQRPALEATLE